MNIEKRLEGNTLAVILEGEMNTLTAPELAKALEGELDGVDGLDVDMHELTYISSAGLRVLLNAYRILEDKNGVTVRGACREIVEVFDSTGFSSFINLVE